MNDELTKIVAAYKEYEAARLATRDAAREFVKDPEWPYKKFPVEYQTKEMETHHRFVEAVENSEYYEMFNAFASEWARDM